MSQKKSKRAARPRRASVMWEEEKAWITFYRRLGDPAVAAELIQHFDADPDMKRAHPALYLRCKQTIRSNKERQARAKRIVHFVRMLMRAVVVTPLMALRRVLRSGGDIAVECLPEARVEPAIRHVKSLAQKPEFANERKGFTNQAHSGHAEQTGDHADKRESRDTKTA